MRYRGPAYYLYHRTHRSEIDASPVARDLEEEEEEEEEEEDLLRSPSVHVAVCDTSYN
jgi:hypothetical protein